MDLIYYPLGGAGIVFLFLQNEPERQILELYDQREDVLLRVEQIEAEMPVVGSTSLIDGYFDTSFEFIELIGNWGEICSSPFVSNYRCPVAEKLSIVTNKYDQLFYSQGESRVETVCSSNQELLADIEREGAVSSFLLEELKNVFEKGYSANYDLYSYEISQNLINEFEDTTAYEILKIIQLANFNSDQIQLMRPIYDAEVEFLTLILRAYFGCFFAPEAMRSGELSRWRESLENENRMILGIEEQTNIEKKKVEEITPLKKINFLIWPYILLIAVAIKFGKGAASIK